MSGPGNGTENLSYDVGKGHIADPQLVVPSVCSWVDGVLMRMGGLHQRDHWPRRQALPSYNQRLFGYHYLLL